MGKYRIKYTVTRTVELEAWNALNATMKLYKHGLDMIQTSTGINELHGPNVDCMNIEELKEVK